MKTNQRHMQQSIQPYQRAGKWFYVSPFSGRELEIRDPLVVAKLQKDENRQS